MINNLLAYYDTIKDNQFLAAGLAMYGAGVLTYIIRDIPSTIFSYVKRHFTTSITITSQNRIYDDAMKWFSEKFKEKNYRTIKLSNGRYGYGDNSIKSIGYGNHFFIYKKIPMVINLIKEESNKTEYDKDTLKITKLGRSHKVLDELNKGFKDQKKPNDGKIQILKFEDGCWRDAKRIHKRAFDSIFIEDHKIQELKNRLDGFVGKEQWYVENGIPYQLGILLHGPPGTGKSSIIKAIASYLNYDIHYIDSADLSKLEISVSKLPDKSIIVIEDIDSNSTTHKRREQSVEKQAIDALSSLDDLMKSSFSSILNSLDGLFSTHGRILITTTNHIDKLDSALIRPGRIDLKMHIDYATIESFTKFINKFFPDNSFDETNYKLKPNLTISSLQNLILQNTTLPQILSLSQDA